MPPSCTVERTTRHRRTCWESGDARGQAKNCRASHGCPRICRRRVSLFEISKRSRSVSMSRGTGTCFGRAVCMGLVQRQVDHVSMTHPAFGNNVVGNALHIRATPLKHGNFHATLLVEMHVQRRLCEVVVLVEIACEALRQFARSVVVNIDQSRHTRMRSANLYGCLLEAGAGEVAD